MHWQILRFMLIYFHRRGNNMNKILIRTGNYTDFTQEIISGKYLATENKIGNLISISGDRGKSFEYGFEGKVLSQLAPKLNFWKIWHNNLGKIDETENTKYYIYEYYHKVLSKIDIMELLKDETFPILLCYEEGQIFCHRHILAEYLNIRYGIVVNDITIEKDKNISLFENSFISNRNSFDSSNISKKIIPNSRPKYIRLLLLEVLREDLDNIQDEAFKTRLNKLLYSDFERSA